MTIDIRARLAEVLPGIRQDLEDLVRMDVEVRTLTHAVHSGMWGGLVPDSLMAMARLIASLHDDEGNVAIDGLYAGPAAGIPHRAALRPPRRAARERPRRLGLPAVGADVTRRCAPVSYTHLTLPTTERV